MNVREKNDRKTRFYRTKMRMSRLRCLTFEHNLNVKYKKSKIQLTHDLDTTNSTRITFNIPAPHCDSIPLF